MARPKDGRRMPTRQTREPDPRDLKARGKGEREQPARRNERTPNLKTMHAAMIPPADKLKDLTRRAMTGARARAAATHDANAHFRTRAKATERRRKLVGG